MQITKKKKPITLYNAVDRYQEVAREVKAIEVLIEDLKDVAHPGVFDIHLHFSMLHTATQGAADSFESGNLKKITPKHLRMLNNLESLVDELRTIVKEARAELLPS